MKYLITLAFFGLLVPSVEAQPMMLFSRDSLANITSPLDLDSLFYWFAADVGVTDSLGGAIATDEGVGTWNDLSGNGHHVTQTTNGARPVWKATGGPGSKPCIQFDGTNDFLASATHFWGSDDITVIVVVKFVDAGRDVAENIVGKYETGAPLTDHRQWIVSGGNDVNENRARMAGSNTGTAAQFWQKSYPVKSTAWRLHVYTDNNSAYTWHEDGSSITIDASTSSGTKTAIANFNDTKLGVGAGAVTATPANFLLGSISEIIVYSRALTTAERTAIENYLNKKYDLY